ncbi:RNA polymerase sigma factor [Pseudovibrio axinellae]|uniref:RNA polymerase sigma factor n=1 Tax=Pseudovibrio axinellae TaxID=989403 RepID=A0A166AQG5_9HYPH|nr:RNA polymerase sigma factor [Pseudovibrio axinellae]KZL21422.1 RNA polymerase sigma factor [Pseudovibrio axinellae]SEQ99701.1 RNA polymerase, sigma-24 subunit, RpoE [Pseudovibrio axinellae]
MYCKNTQFEHLDGRHDLTPVWKYWNENRRKIFGRAFHLTSGDMDAAEELMSATIIKVASHFEQRPLNMREPIAFFMYALKNEFISQYRKKRYEYRFRDGEKDVYDEHLAPAEVQSAPQEVLLAQKEELMLIGQTLEKLPVIYQQIFSMKFVEDRSYSEISEELNISQALARKRVQFLREKLRNARSRKRGRLA